MDFLSNINWVQVLCFVCPAALGVAGWVASSLIDERIRGRREAHRVALRKRGVTSPAVIVSVRRKQFAFRSPGAPSDEYKLIFEVDIQREGHGPFRATFEDWIRERNYTYVNMQRVDIIGRKIWVTYDPHNLSNMFFEYYDEDRERILAASAWQERRNAFEKLNKQNRALFKTGVEAPAVILEAEDLGLATQFDNAKVMRLKLEVTPKLGSPYQAETQEMIASGSLEKYSAGKKVLVKVDPRNEMRVTLFRSAETS
jgi:hypothetical protein